MLHHMQQPIEPSPSPSSSPSFAGLLAALAAKRAEVGDGDGSSTLGWKSEVPGDRPKSQGRKPAAAWNDDDLADDVATLSYERALRAHTRYRSTDLPDPLFTQAADAEPFHLEESSPGALAEAPQPATRSTASPKPTTNPAPEPSRPRVTQFERNLKDASVTIRMSQTECAQLHHRAAEAGLSVSAYLRSCTFEAESLRAMVRDTLEQLRAATTPTKPTDQAMPSRPPLRRMTGWFPRLFTPWQGNQRVARA
ncbi:MAG: hypothetical protein ABSE51_03895 [Terracidiphilus sp.]